MERGILASPAFCETPAIYLENVDLYIISELNFQGLEHFRGS